ncbi:zinc-dependent alcohol dehydrogenase family protein [Pseudomonas lalucatii]|uniref:Zinc-dependent alcohol dehydrogenase family protein n=1 Tax=Pseudomonas lalucatii TaxID=1424203 RepID=A0ABS5PY79_9PSED|nr:zinc-dependent alcohol dehydrogenase family protein [Pseudomonas lalucatii]MBS7661329.1 zinc-dependent alcohol dehydrogenase family protein [Pseudomonas lalucatii]MBS7724157.1 zinc-dependent alcohol dehydrogenase family protein [Pseudomonas lalucatii]QVM87841.1 zinc-dependent alcohol dehydrogenase family protein [Pseudomonas lalucatii]
MKAMIINEFGGADLFVPAELATPAVKPGHVLVRVAATSVNTVDMMIRQMGKKLPIAPDLPAVLGMDFAGTVEALGAGVTDYAIGDEVYGCAGGLGELPGALAQYMPADARLIARKPKNLSMREAAALPLVGITAYEGLKRAGIAEDQQVLVHGGSGGVGHIAVQLARHFGARVFSTGGAEAQLALIESLGAVAINYREQSVADYVEQHTDGAGFDVVFDSVGAGNLVNSFEAAALNGQVATTVSLVELDLSTAHFKGLSLHVVFMLIPMIHDRGRAAHGKILAELASIAEAGGLRPVLDEQRFGLVDVARAHERLASGLALGKVVIEV